MLTGIELIAQERKEQLEKHNRTIEKDIIVNEDFQLSEAASVLCHPDIVKSAEETLPAWWSFDVWRKMCDKSYADRLVIAGALIAAEIDRLNAE